jgi:GTP cyclohydrolase II
MCTISVHLSTEQYADSGLCTFKFSLALVKDVELRFIDMGRMLLQYTGILKIAVLTDHQKYINYIVVKEV